MPKRSKKEQGVDVVVGTRGREIARTTMPPGFALAERHADTEEGEDDASRKPALRMLLRAAGGVLGGGVKEPRLGPKVPPRQGIIFVW